MRRPIYPARISDLPAGCRGGFSLIETLVAAGILAAIAGVFLTAHLQSRRTADTARWIESARFEAVRVATRHRLGMQPSELQTPSEPGFRIEEEIMPGESAGSAGQWRRWVITPTNHPALQTTLLMRR